MLDEVQLSNMSVKMELFAAMMSVLIFISEYCNIYSENKKYEIVKWFFTPLLDIPKNKYNQITEEIDDRINFYLGRERNKEVRGEFLLEDILDITKK